MARPRYNDDPSVGEIPLSVDEAAWVLANVKSVKGFSNLEHYARRALATAQAVAQLRVNYDNELRRRSVPTSTSAATNLSPEAAARFLSPDQLANLFDKLSQDKLAQLNSQQEKARQAQEQAAQVLILAAEQLEQSSITGPEAAEQLRIRAQRLSGEQV